MISIANKLLNECVYNHNKTIIYDCDTASVVDNGSREKLFIFDLFTELCGNIFVVNIKNENNFTGILCGVLKHFTAKGLSGGFCWKLLCAASISKKPLIVIAEKQPTVKYISSPFVVERLNDSIYSINQNYLN